jgi:hypothetical protein
MLDRLIIPFDHIVKGTKPISKESGESSTKDKEAEKIKLEEEGKELYEEPKPKRGKLSYVQN